MADARTEAGSHDGTTGARARPLAVWLACALIAPGCSFLFVQQAPPEQAWPRLVWASCTDSLAAPVVDAVVAGSTLLAASNSNPEAGLTPFLVTGAATAASAIWGWLQTSRCGELRNYMEQRTWGGTPLPMAEQPASPEQPATVTPLPDSPTSALEAPR